MASSIIGQDEDKLEFFVGPELEEQRGNSIWKTFGHSDDFFFCMRADRRKKGQFLIEKIGVDSLTVLKTVQFQLSEVSGKLPVMAYPMSTKNASFLIATAEDQDGSDIFIMAYSITDDLQIKKEPLIIGIADREALISENGFLTFKSEDEKKVALFIPKERNPVRNEKFELRYFDSGLNLLEIKNIEIPYPSANVLLEDAVLTPNGVFHGVISIQNESEVRILPNSYALLTYHPAEDGVKEKALSLGNKWFYDVNLTVTPDTNLWLSGYYSNMVEPSMVGTFSVVIASDTGELLDTGLSPFDRDFRLMFRQDMKSDQDDLGLFKLEEAFLKKNGLLSMISEKRFSRESTIYEPATRMYTTVQVHYYEEILITTIRPSSKIMENILIPKYQSAYQQFGRYTSYVSTQWGDKLLFFYNDHFRNESLSPTEYNNYRSLNNENNMNITYCVVSDGKLIKKTLKPETTDDYYLDAGQHYRTSNSQILTTYKGYKTKYLKVLTP
ncbi:MAG TPA: hypothetical protein VJ949_13310 [Cryomorphaceae bacterium]|nr:hypothetical protein [Cryomorphaceae bacterium]